MLVAANARLQRDIGYIVRMEPGIQACDETLSLRRGSCRDSAWLLVQIFRHLGLAARFASGYLIQLSADIKALEGPSGPEKDFTDLHAWTEVYVPGAGWIGLDPTSGLFAGEGHIPLACTAAPSSAAPVIGYTDVSEVQFGFHMKVSRVHEDPRVTLPYDERRWADIDALARKVDTQLSAWDVRLTMGGEPTFVSIDDMDGAEWNTAALGENKRDMAGALWLRLREQFASGGLLHEGQGKMVPRRAASALGADLLVARGWQGALEERGLARRRSGRSRYRVHSGAPLCHEDSCGAGPACRLRDSGVRGRLASDAGRAETAGQSRSAGAES
jgi:hypothetical protein